MSGSSFSRSYGLPTSVESYGFGLMGLLRSRVDAKNKRDLSMSEGVGVGGGKLLTSSSGSLSGGLADAGGLSGTGGQVNPNSLLGDVDKFQEQLFKEIEALRKREGMRTYPIDGATSKEGEEDGKTNSNTTTTTTTTTNPTLNTKKDEEKQ